MKTLILLALLGIVSPAMAAEAPAPAEKTEQPAKAEAPAPETEQKPGEYECKYYKVQLPDEWKAIIPPTDQQGTINAIFATNTGSSVVTMIVGPSGGADIKTIATMFAEQFKAPRAPSDKNGQYVFSFPIQNGTAQAIVSGSGPDFMVTTIAGSLKQAQEFLRNNVSSENYSSLMPK